MKRFKYYGLLFGLIFFNLSSCQLNEEDIKLEDENCNSLIIASKVSDNQLRNSIDFINKKINSKQLNIDQESAILITKDSTIIVSFGIKNDSETKKLSIYLDKNNNPLNLCLTDIKRTSDKELEISYFSYENQELMLKVRINYETKQSEIVYKRNESSKSLADDTLNCIADVYTGHGWWSVAMVVASTLDPYIGATVVASCIIGQAIN